MDAVGEQQACCRVPQRVESDGWRPEPRLGRVQRLGDAGPCSGIPAGR
jgi:hypothetical protein